ncbi:calcineurin temperature suppressor Cts1 [Coprinopsis sp. MPI-PUGE-AT-0042]|nr:calcineurin temperature suppressor Cts1 [Coprinopsis sp. MPI-PUGE-AT-0042]
MSSTPREIGTLIVVVLKANHLPNKRHIGKQDPYCVVVVNGEKRRTKAIKRGGQHPEWDEEIRFTLYEDTDDNVLPRASSSSDPPPLPPKDGPSSRKIKGGTFMKLACYADDAREPDLIGEANVDLTEVLTKGETDEWFNLNHKDKFAGKVYLELTFWSNEPPPEKKAAPKAPKNNKQYGGPGSFIPSGERVPGKNLSRHASANASGPPDLYVAPYEQSNQVDRLAQDFGEFGLNGSHRRQSAPPLQGYSHYTHPSYNGYPQDTASSYSYDRAHSPSGQASAFAPNSQFAYPGQYDPNAPAPYPPVPHGHRHTLPPAPSGFVPLPQPSGFVPLQPQADTYAPPVSHTPAPMQYPPAPSGFVTSNSYPQTVSPVTYGTPTGAYQQTLPASQSYPYHSYSYAPSAPPQPHYPPSDYAQSTAPQSQIYPSPNGHPESTLPLPAAPPTVGGSRPLPPQPVVYSQPPASQQMTSPPPLPPPPHMPSQNGTYSPSYQPPGSVSPAQLGSSHPLPVPPPPPAPPSMYGDGSSYAHGTSQTATHSLPPPPPPPASVAHEVRQRRLSSLPQPPTMYHQPPVAYQPGNGTVPDNYNYNQPPQSTYLPQPPGPPPQPPALAEWTAYNNH